MNDNKTIDEVLKEKQSLADTMTDMVNQFLKDNPQVLNIQIDNVLYAEETKCGLLKDATVIIKLTI